MDCSESLLQVNQQIFAKLRLCGTHLDLGVFIVYEINLKVDIPLDELRLIFCLI